MPLWPSHCRRSRLSGQGAGWDGGWWKEQPGFRTLSGFLLKASSPQVWPELLKRRLQMRSRDQTPLLLCLLPACFIHASSQRAHRGGPSGQGDPGLGPAGLLRGCPTCMNTRGWRGRAGLSPGLGPAGGCRGATESRGKRRGACRGHGVDPPHPRTCLIQGHLPRKPSCLSPSAAWGLLPAPCPGSSQHGWGLVASCWAQRQAQCSGMMHPDMPWCWSWASHPCGSREASQAVPSRPGQGQV